jgi:hypothetical protein
MRGFTLFESLIYLSLFSLVMSGVLTNIYIVAESANRYDTQTITDTDTDFNLRHELLTQVDTQEFSSFISTFP